MFKGMFVASQYTHARPHFSRTYSRISYPYSVPCWYPTPVMSGSFAICRSNFTDSTCRPVTGAHRASRSTQAVVVVTGCSRDGASQPFGRVRLVNRGARWAPVTGLHVESVK